MRATVYRQDKEWKLKETICACACGQKNRPMGKLDTLAVQSDWTEAAASCSITSCADHG